MKQKAMVLLAVMMCFTLLLAPNVQAQTITENEIGTHDGYDYEYWKDEGTGSMTLTEGGTFSCEWSNINNILFRKGQKFDETQTHQELGNIVVEYDVDYNPDGNSYLCIYGWTVDPLVEYYIVDSWGSWRPPGSTSMGQITVDGGTYDIYETTRTEQPSIIGTATFQQYWSVRTSKKTSGTISVTEHFLAWEDMGMPMGNMYEVALTVEGWQSEGSAVVNTNDLIVGGEMPDAPDTSEPSEPSESDMPENPGPSSRSAFSTIEVEEYNDFSSSTMEIVGTDDGGDGIGYIENGDTLTFNNVDFGSNGSDEFTARVGSDVEDPTDIEVRVGSSTGTLLGTLEVGSTGDWDEYTELSTDISSVTGENDIVLVFTGPVNIDWITFSEAGEGTTPVDPDPQVIYGDLNGDGVIDSSDYTLLQRYILEIPVSIDDISVADLNGDGVIDSTDATLLSRYILEIIDSFPVED
ncbi:glycoside hydrolase family 11 protein [Herbivorax sp. ANBcel31]|nr:glycoside hydrolase family 11 protein [Herbivorax sp. ANBcel31]MDQ2084880.1 glycoside hydrolase family 11 protein [Herbivorax sp. ANBcel31]